MKLVTVSSALSLEQGDRSVRRSLMIRHAVPILLAAACGNSHNATADAAAQIDALADSSTSRSGLIFLSQQSSLSSAGAIFAQGSAFGTLLGTVGSCSAYSNLPSKGLSAGSIAIGGTATALTLVPTGTNPNVSYAPSPTPPDPLFSAGASITVSAPGTTDFPGFSATATGPATLAGFTPPSSISRSAGFSATWTAGTGPRIQIQVIAFGAGGASNPDVLLCFVPDSGSYAVPAPALALLPSADNMAAVSVGRTDEVTVANPAVTILVSSYILGGTIPLNL